jgi:hypothetical protein
LPAGSTTFTITNKSVNANGSFTIKTSA